MARRVSYESSGMGSILPIAVLGGIGYLVYKNWDQITGMFGISTASKDFIDAAKATGVLDKITTLPSIPLSVTNPSGNPNITVGSQVNTPSNATSSESTYAKMSRWISQNVDWYTKHAGLATFDEWNAIRGNFESASQSVEDIFPDIDRNATMTLQEYFNGLTSKGVSGGVGASLGLGQILDMGDFFSKTPRVLRRGNFR